MTPVFPIFSCGFWSLSQAPYDIIIGVQVLNALKGGLNVCCRKAKSMLVANLPAASTSSVSTPSQLQYYPRCSAAHYAAREQTKAEETPPDKASSGTCSIPTGSLGKGIFTIRVLKRKGFKLTLAMPMQCKTAVSCCFLFSLIPFQGQSTPNQLLTSELSSFGWR